MFGEYPTDPDEEFDQCGCEIPDGFQAFPEETDQELLFDECYQPDPPQGDPIFWPSESVQAYPEEDYIRRNPVDIH